MAPLLLPGLYAPVQQHFFVARLGMAVDCKPGEAYNQVVEVKAKIEEPGKDNVHNNAFYAEETLLRSELEAMRDVNPLTARHWIVRNTRAVNRTRQLTGYRLVPGSNRLPLAGPEAKFLRRAAFLKHNLWLTQYARGEDFPGGGTLNKTVQSFTCCSLVCVWDNACTAVRRLACGTPWVYASATWVLQLLASGGRTRHRIMEGKEHDGGGKDNNNVVVVKAFFYSS